MYDQKCTDLYSFQFCIIEIIQWIFYISGVNRGRVKILISVMSFMMIKGNREVKKSILNCGRLNSDTL